MSSQVNDRAKYSERETLSLFLVVVSSPNPTPKRTRRRASCSKAFVSPTDRVGDADLLSSCDPRFPSSFPSRLDMYKAPSDTDYPRRRSTVAAETHSLQRDRRGSSMITAEELGSLAGASRKGRSTRLVRRLVPLLLVGLCTWLFFSLLSLARLQDATTSQIQRLWQGPASSSYSSIMSSSALKAITQRSVLARKTGYSVVFERLPMHLLEPRPDIPHIHVYSDAPLKLGEVQVVDVLANVTDDIRHQEAFSGYSRLHRAIRDRVPPEHGWGMWNVDKFKFLPLHGDLYRKHPTADWFISVDGDTYLFWSTLMRFLARFDPGDQLFFGKANAHGLNGAGDTVWANGGAGYVLSKGIMDQTYAKDPWGFENKWSEMLSASPGGDVAMARAIYQSPGIVLNNTLTGGEPM